MACAACGKQRRRVINAAASGRYKQAASEIATGVGMIADKMAGIKPRDHTVKGVRVKPQQER